jgi:DNA mismatch endonuclease (patch repair protein)
LRVVIFVDGCFWHGCPRCYRRPASNTKYWDSKVSKNRQRDRKVRVTLRRCGWRVLRIWEHELARKNQSRLLRRLQVALL